MCGGSSRRAPANVSTAPTGPKAERSGSSANSKHLGRLTSRLRATDCRAAAGSDEYLTEDMLLEELASSTIHQGDTAQHSADVAVAGAGMAATSPRRRTGRASQRGDRPTARTRSQTGARRRREPGPPRCWPASPGDTKYALLNENPVAGETFASDKGSPLMAQTITKAAATASAAAGSIRQLPGVLKPPVMTLRTLALGGYRRGVVDQRHGQVVDHGRRRATRFGRRRRSPMRNLVRRHGPDHGWNRCVSRCVGNLAVLRQAVVRSRVGNPCRRGTRRSRRRSSATGCLAPRPIPA